MIVICISVIINDLVILCGLLVSWLMCSYCSNGCMLCWEKVLIRVV